MKTPITDKAWAEACALMHANGQEALRWRADDMRKACAYIEKRLIRAEEALRGIINSAEALDRILPTASGNDIVQKFRVSICGAKSCLVSPNAEVRDAADQKL